MKNARNIGADYYRTIMLLLVVVYHAWVINGRYPIYNQILSSVVMLGGEIGVTGFFVLSGWAIYKSLNNNHDKYFGFLKKRFKRIAPEYYVSVIIVLFFTSGAGWLSKAGIKSVFATIFFVQNVLPNLSAVNGVLWTMSVTVMYYLISPFLYKCLNRWKSFFVIFIICFTVLMKYIFFHWGVMYIHDNQFYLSRQTIITDLDNFVLGMFVAYISNGIGEKMHGKQLFCFTGLIISICAIVFYGIVGLNYGIHTDNISGYTWHSVIAILLAANLLFWNMINIPHFFEIFKISSIIALLARHQYGIYVFHLLVIQNLVTHSELVQILTGLNYLLSQMIIITISTAVGVIMSIMVRLAMKEVGRKSK